MATHRPLKFHELEQLRPVVAVGCEPAHPVRQSFYVSGSSDHPPRIATSDWPATRGADDPNNNILHVRTVKWLAALPADVRPMATARQYPRIVNRIDDLWAHCEYTRLYFQSILIDRRKGRKGFPPDVRCELEVLQHYYFEHLSGLPAILWNAVPMFPPRIPDRTFVSRADTTEIEILPLSMPG